MKKIKVTAWNLLEHFGLDRVDQLTGEILAPLILNEAVLSTNNETFIIKEIKLLSSNNLNEHYSDEPKNQIVFLGNICRAGVLFSDNLPEKHGPTFLFIKE